jgi:hypothetical protein
MVDLAPVNACERLVNVDLLLTQLMQSLVSYELLHRVDVKGDGRVDFENTTCKKLQKS